MAACNQLKPMLELDIKLIDTCLLYILIWSSSINTLLAFITYFMFYIHLWFQYTTIVICPSYIYIYIHINKDYYLYTYTHICMYMQLITAALLVCLFCNKILKLLILMSCLINMIVGIAYTIQPWQYYNHIRYAHGNISQLLAH